MTSTPTGNPFSTLSNLSKLSHKLEATLDGLPAKPNPPPYGQILAHSLKLSTLTGAPTYFLPEVTPIIGFGVPSVRVEEIKMGIVSVLGEAAPNLSEKTIKEETVKEETVKEETVKEETVKEEGKEENASKASKANAAEEAKKIRNRRRTTEMTVEAKESVS